MGMPCLISLPWWYQWPCTHLFGDVPVVASSLLTLESSEARDHRSIRHVTASFGPPSKAGLYKVGLFRIVILNSHSLLKFH